MAVNPPDTQSSRDLYTSRFWFSQDIEGQLVEWNPGVAGSKNLFTAVRAHDARSHSKQQYDTLASKIQIGTNILKSKQDGSFALDDVSPRAAELYEASEQSLLADFRIAFQMIPPDDRDAFIKLNRKGIERLRTFEWIGRVQC